MASKTNLTVSCVVVLLAAPVFVWVQQRELRAATAAWAALPASAARVDYVLVDRRQETSGSGKSRRTHYYLELARREARPGAPDGVTVEVGSKVHAATPDGTRWTARVVGGQAHFDPLQTARELERSRATSLAAGVMMVLAAALLFYNLKLRRD